MSNNANKNNKKRRRIIRIKTENNTSSKRETRGPMEEKREVGVSKWEEEKNSEGETLNVVTASSSPNWQLKTSNFPISTIYGCQVLIRKTKFKSKNHLLSILQQTLIDNFFPLGESYWSEYIPPANFHDFGGPWERKEGEKGELVSIEKRK